MATLTNSTALSPLPPSLSPPLPLSPLSRHSVDANKNTDIYTARHATTTTSTSSEDTTTSTSKDAPTTTSSDGKQAQYISIHDVVAQPLYAAAARTLNTKLEDRGGHTSWSAAWQGCLSARLHQAEDSWQALKRILML